MGMNDPDEEDRKGKFLIFKKFHKPLDKNNTS